MATKSEWTGDGMARTESDGLTQWLPEPPASGQYNLFTGELEPFPDGPSPLPEEAWLFDPDFGLVLPDDPAGREVLVEPGIALQFPLGNRGQGTGYRANPKSKIQNSRAPNPKPRTPTCPWSSENARLWPRSPGLPSALARNDPPVLV